MDLDSRECVILNELMSRGSLDSVLHLDKIPLDWNTRLGIVSFGHETISDCHTELTLIHDYVSVCVQVRDVCCGMAFLHSHEVLHRSLIPDNILIGEHFNAKLSDFVSVTSNNNYRQLRMPYHIIHILGSCWCPGLVGDKTEE